MLCLFLTLAPTLTQAAGGRLFTTPEQRARINQLRAATTAEELARAPKLPPPSAKKAVPEPPPRVHLRGFVRRSDGPSTIWANDGSTLPGAGLGDGITAGDVSAGGVQIRLPNGRRLQLQPGQTWDPATGRVHDVTGQ